MYICTELSTLCVFSHSLCTIPQEAGAIIPILQMMKPWLREVNVFKVSQLAVADLGFEPRHQDPNACPLNSSVAQPTN